MAKKRTAGPVTRRPLKNQRRARATFGEVWSTASRRAHEQVNRRSGRPGDKLVWAMVAAAEVDDDIDHADWMKRLIRWVLAVVMLPLCWVTSWTFLSRFSQATVNQNFWKTAEFWYFATGVMVMLGWFWSGLLQRFFLYLYVLGHELTHAVFVVLFRGRVTDFHVSTEGGYITTNKTNMVIALSPYFVPFWSVVSAAIYLLARHFAGFSGEWDRVLYALLGATWTFHMVWTIWMIPRDQPDLKENGTFLSLVIIYLANLLIMTGLLCISTGSVWENTQEFGMEWLRNAATWGDAFLRWVQTLRH